MTSILGNQEQRRSKIDTERWKEHKKYYSNPENLKKTETKETIGNSESQILEKILKYDEGKPQIELTEVDTAVNTTTRKEYDTLMQIYDSAGWKWRDGWPPTTQQLWQAYRSETCINTDRRVITYDERQWYVDQKISVITLNEFHKLQKIKPETIKELNEWYDKNKPDRESKHL